MTSNPQTKKIFHTSSQSISETQQKEPNTINSPEAESTNAAYKKRSSFEYIGASFRGICMGAADVVPGVSGGTMALILGIYRELVASLRAFDLHALTLLFKGNLRKLIRHTNLYFLASLAIGIGVSVASLSKIIPSLLHTYPAPVQGLFFGLILASIVIVGGQIEKHSVLSISFLLGGAFFSYMLVGMIPAQTPDHPAFLFLCGSIAIIAMILPGISGAFILLLLGKYVFILESIRHVIHHPQLDSQFFTVLIFSIGCGAGLLSFSRLLNWLLKEYNTLTLSLLCGFMIGSLRRIWPYQIYQKAQIGTKIVVVEYANTWPTEWTSSNILAASLIFLGIFFVFALHFIANKKPITREI